MTKKSIGIYSDIFTTNKKSAISKIGYDLYFYLQEYGFTVGLIDTTKDVLGQILKYDVVLAVPDLCTLGGTRTDGNSIYSLLTDDECKKINEKVIPIFHHYIFTKFYHFKHPFFHGFWTGELGYTNHNIGKEIDMLKPKYKKSYLPIGVDTSAYFPTRKITKIKKVGFVGLIENNMKFPESGWTLNKRPQMFIDIAKGAGVEAISISENKNYNDLGLDRDGHELYDGVDLIICTSVEEGNPMGLLESIACKIPFISTKVGLTEDYHSIKTFNTIDEAITIINELNSSEELLCNYISNTYDEVIPDRDWRNLIPKYWLPHIIKKLNAQSHYDFIEIGTSDFSTLLQENPDKKGISIEPIKVYYDALPNPIKGYKLQCAVSDFDGTIEMNWVHPSDILDHSLPDWLRGCNSIGSHIHRDKFSSNLIRKELVKTITWDTLVKTHNVQSVDTIKIDTEGHDHIILSQILDHCELEYFRPSEIVFENNELANKNEIVRIVDGFINLGYSYIEGYDSQLIYSNYKKYESIQQSNTGSLVGPPQT
jgi:FkbM family methyltransferase